MKPRMPKWLAERKQLKQKDKARLMQKAPTLLARMHPLTLVGILVVSLMFSLTFARLRTDLMKTKDEREQEIIQRVLRTGRQP